jgi:hypothetical protein
MSASCNCLLSRLVAVLYFIPSKDSPMTLPFHLEDSARRRRLRQQIWVSQCPPHLVYYYKRRSVHRPLGAAGLLSNLVNSASPFIMFWQSITAIALFAQDASARGQFLRFGCSQLVVERADPLVNPGVAQTPHTHQIVGGNSFNISVCRISSLFVSSYRGQR